MHSSCSFSCCRTWQVVSGPVEGMEERERQLSGEGGGKEGEDWSRMEAGTALSPTVGAFLNDQLLEQHL